MLYVFSLIDYEDYAPYWFDCNCTKEEFNEAVSKAIDYAVDFIIKDEPESYVSGYDLIDIVVQRLQEINGYKLLRSDYEVSISGYFFNDDDKPVAINDSTWEKIKNQRQKVEEL